MVKIEKLQKRFNTNQVLNSLDLEINKAGVFAVVGPNGSGKTTLIKAILGMIVPDEGIIHIMGENIEKNAHYRTQIDYLPQIANFPTNLKVSELINMIKDLRKGKTCEDKSLISLFELEPFLNKKLGALSGGTKQKVNLLLTFMFDSPLMILDEPTTGLDPIALLHLKTMIKSQKTKGKTVLITSHIMDFVEEISDEIVFLLEGNIHFKGTINALKSKTGHSSFELAIASILRQNRRD
jgi:Cu-processing system ATP-binding protein